MLPFLLTSVMDALETAASPAGIAGGAGVGGAMWLAYRLFRFVTFRAVEDRDEAQSERAVTKAELESVRYELEKLREEFHRVREAYMMDRADWRAERRLLRVMVKQLGGNPDDAAPPSRR